MGFREKTLWVSLVATIGVWGLYFVAIARRLIAGEVAPIDSLAGFVQAVVLIVTIQVASTIVIALWRPSEAEAPADARDREFAERSARPALAVLTLCIVVTMIAIPPATLALSRDMLALCLANALLLALVVSELVRSGTQLFLYRRGG